MSRNQLRFLGTLATIGALFLLLCMAMAGCAISSSPREGYSLLEGLAGKGPFVISEKESYLAGYQLLDNERRKRSQLHALIAQKGFPATLQVLPPIEGQWPLILRYTTPAETYEVTFHNQETVIIGPGEPSSHALLGTSSDARASLRISPIPRNSQKERPRTNNERLRSDYSDRNALLTRLVTSAPQHNAERTPHGDLVHYVTYEGETLSLIARWYTLDASNVARITRTNSLPHPDHLEIGDEIIIPSYLIKNGKLLEQPSLKALQKLIERQPSREAND